MQETDSDRFHAILHERLRRAADAVKIERGDDAAVAVHALGHFEPPPARHQRIGIAQKKVVDVIALLCAHLEEVTESRRRHETQSCALALDKRVADERCAMHDLADVGESETGDTE